MTYTFVLLEVSREAYDEIRAKLVDAGYTHAIDVDLSDVDSAGRGVEQIDMHGIALVMGDPR